MPTLSQATWDLITQLHQGPRLLYRLSGRRLKPISVIDRIGDSGEAAAIPWLVASILHSDPEIQGAAAKAVFRLYSRAKRNEYSVIDAALRTAHGLPREWFGLDAAGFGRLRQNRQTLGAICILGACHPRGYVRQAAVAEIGKSGDAVFLPLVLLRLNDWVPEVRAEARKALHLLLRPENALAVVERLAMFHQLQRSRRADHAWLLSLAEDLVQNPQYQAAFQQGIRSAEREVRRLSLLTVLQAGETAPGVMAEAMSDPDVSIRRAAISRLPGLSDQEAYPLLDRAVRDPAAIIRRNAYRMLLGRFPEEVERRIEDIAFDGSPTIREIAHELRSAASLLSMYRNRIGHLTGRELQGALGGLAEMGSKEDAPLVVSNLNSPSPRTRRAALRALARLDPGGSIDLIWRMLRDQSPPVSRTARDMLIPQLHRIPIAEIEELFRSGDPLDARLHGLFLLAQLGKWRSLPYLLEAISSREEAVAGLALDRLNRWLSRYNTVFTDPRPGEMETAWSALRAAELRLPTDFVREMEGILRSWEPSR